MKMVDEGDWCDLFEMCKPPGVCEKVPGEKKSKCVPCKHVCPTCQIPNDTCDGCVPDPNEDDGCDPCSYDANGQNGHAICAKLTGDPAFKCCSPKSACTAPDGHIDNLLPSTVTWKPSTFICSVLCEDDEGGTCTTSGSQKTCAVGDPIELQDDNDDTTSGEITTCSCQMDCPKCHKPNDTCDKCIIDEDSDDDCDPCDANAGGVTGNDRCTKFGQAECCALDSV